MGPGLTGAGTTCDMCPKAGGDTVLQGQPPDAAQLPFQPDCTSCNSHSGHFRIHTTNSGNPKLAGVATRSGVSEEGEREGVHGLDSAHKLPPVPWVCVMLLVGLIRPRGSTRGQMSGLHESDPACELYV